MKQTLLNRRALSGRNFVAFRQAAMALSLALAALLTAPAQAQVLYRETFGNNTNADLTLSAIPTSWQALSSQTGPTTVLTSTAVNKAASIPTNLPNVGTGQTTLSQTNGFIYNSAGYPNNLFYTQLPASPGAGVQGPINSLNYGSVTFSWEQNNTTVSGSPLQKYVRLAVLCDGVWYVTSDKFFSANSTFDGSWGAVTQQSFTFSLDKTAWLVLSNVAVSANPMTIGAAPASNLTGVISGFGIFDVGRTNGGPQGSLLFDSFTVSVTAIPEPSSLALLGAGVLFVAWRVRRR